MTNPIRIAVLTLAVTVLAGCASGNNRSASTGRTPAPVADRATVQRGDLAERACLRDVALEANTQDVVLLDVTRSQTGAEVIIGVGPQRARWRCIGYNDGTTTVVISLQEERQL
ncbi:MAG: hypothetical protein WBM40_00625 [Thiohalocapsa sp.]